MLKLSMQNDCDMRVKAAQQDCDIVRQNCNEHIKDMRTICDMRTEAAQQDIDARIRSLQFKLDQVEEGIADLLNNLQKRETDAAEELNKWKTCATHIIRKELVECLATKLACSVVKPMAISVHSVTLLNHGCNRFRLLMWILMIQKNKNVGFYPIY